MKNYTTFLNILKGLVTDEDILKILLKYDYVDVATKFTVAAMLNFFTTASLNEWEGYRHGCDVSKNYGLVSVDHSTVSKKAKAVPFEIFKEIFTLVCSRCNRNMRRQLKYPKELLLTDSTTVTVGKTRLLWAPYHGERAGIKLHTALNLSTGLTQKVEETTALQHDSPMLNKLIDTSCILVADRAYFQIERLDDFLKKEQYFVIRVKTNVEMGNKKFLKRIDGIDSNVINDFTCRLGSVQKRSLYRHRIVEFTDYEGKLIRVATNLRNVSAQIVADIYKARWAVEVFFRWIKQNLNVPKLFGTTKNAVYSQLYAALLAYVILKFIHATIIKKISYKKLQFSLLEFTRKLIDNNLPAEWIVQLQYFSRTIVRL